MTSASTPRLQALSDLLAQAAVLEEMAAERYETLAGTMREHGNQAVAALFDGLAQEERRHRDVVHDLGGGAITDRAKNLWRSRLTKDMEDVEALPLSLSAYQALAFAVRNEVRTFRHYSYVASQATDPTTASAAEALAREELAHAALLRRARRRAFHADRAGASYLSTAPALPLTQDALCLAALKHEQNLLMLLEALGGLDDDLERLRTRTLELIERLTEIAKILGLSVEPHPERLGQRDGSDDQRTPRVDLRVRLDQAFALYDQVVERTKDEDALPLAQELAAAAIERLELLSNTPSESH